MFENYMVNRNGCKVVMGGLLMVAVWLTSRSLRLATSGKTVAFCISFVQSPFLYYKQKAHKEVFARSGKKTYTPYMHQS